MCNLYRLNPRDWATKFAQDAEAFDNLVNIMESYEVYPDREGLIIRNTAAGGRQLAHVRWGLPSSKKALFDAASKRADKLTATLTLKRKGLVVGASTFATGSRRECLKGWHIH